MRKLILASSSIYRRQLLEKLQLEFFCRASHVDESPGINENPSALALRLATAKAHAIRDDYSNHLIIGSDQVATFDDILLGKPGNRDNAFQQLKAQSGKKVSFYTGICVLDSHSGEFKTELDCCDVYFRPLSGAQIDRYLDKEQPFDCAGSFKSESYGITLFDKIVGEDPNSLVGLPLIKLAKLLNDFGLSLP
jgi:septum formation protein